MVIIMVVMMRGGRDNFQSLGRLIASISMC